MKKSLTRKIFVLGCAVIFMLSLFTGILFWKNKAVSISVGAEELFAPTTSVQFSKGIVASDGSFPDKEGLLLTTKIDGAKVHFQNVYAGKFEVELFPVSQNKGIADFESIVFNIYDKAGVSRDLKIELLQDEEAETLSVYAYYDATRSSSWTRFTLSASIVKVGFDSETMSIYAVGDEPTREKTLLSLASGAVSGIATVNDVPKIDSYTVEMVISNISDGKEANLLLYSLNGQSLGGSNLTNEKGADIVRAYLYSGVRGMEYVVAEENIVVCDALDGIGTFYGMMSVTAPSGNSVSVYGNTFTPEQTGVHILTLQAQDKDGILGTAKTFAVNIRAKHEPIQMETFRPIQDSVIGAGSTIAVYPVQAYSKYFGGKLDVITTVVCGGNELYRFENLQKTQYINLANTGEYVISYTAKDSLRQSRTLSFNVTVDEFACLAISGLQTVYSQNEYFTVPEYQTIEGTEILHNVVFPNGSKVNAERVFLDKIGQYTLEFTIKQGGQIRVQKYYFDVKATASELFETTKDMIVTPNASSPEYMDVRLNGAMLSAGLVNATATYKNVVNLSEMTSKDLLFEVYITPQTKNTEELKRFAVRITDAYDENNYLTVSFYPNQWGYKNSMMVASYYQEEKNGLEVMVASSRYGKYPAFSDGTYQYTSGFSSTLRVYWDNETKIMYVNDGAEIVKIVDLDDPNDVGVNVFNGFTTGEARISFIFEEPMSTAHLLVSNIAGQALGGEYIESANAPEIVLQWSEESFPTAQVGKAYPIFDAYGLDMVEGELYVSATVYAILQDGIRQRVCVDNGKFTPNKAGEYVIEYQTVNGNGLFSQKSIVITAKDAEEISPVTMELVGAYSESATQGETIVFLPMNTLGGSGYITTKLIVCLNGQELYTLSDYDYKTLILENAGEYTLKYVATDSFIEGTKNVEYTLLVTSPENPVFAELNMPKGVIKGAVYELPIATAYDYSDGTKKEARVITKINGVALADESKRNVSFDKTGIATVEYQAINANGKSNCMSFEIEVVDLSATTKPAYLSRYFLYENSVTASASQEAIAFTANNTERISFINKIPVDIFYVSFAIVSQQKNLDSLRVILTDSLNPTEKVVFTIAELENSINQSAFWINGIAQNAFGGAVGGTGVNGTMSIRLNGTKIMDSADTSFNLVTESGSAFSGFSSGFVYLDFEIVNPKNNAGVQVRSIANQIIATVSTDRITPNVYLKEQIQLNAEKGVVYTIPKTRVFDVLDPNARLYVKVMKGEETIVEKTDYYDGMQITFNEYGKYNLLLIGQDNNNKKEIESSYLIKVYDRVAPTLEIVGDKQEKIAVGADIIPAKVETNGELFIFVVSPDGKINLINGSFKTTLYGVYRVIYYARNAYDVCSVKSYNVFAE